MRRLMGVIDHRHDTYTSLATATPGELRGAARRVARNRKSSGWPQHSIALAVHPKQIAKATAHSHKIGVPVTFDGQGNCILENRSHRKRYCEAIGAFDRNGGYGDPQPK